MGKINWNILKPGDVVTFYFSSPTEKNICFQFKTWDDYYIYGTKGEKYERYILCRAIEVGVMR
jgi:hypothetical protein